MQEINKAIEQLNEINSRISSLTTNLLYCFVNIDLQDKSEEWIIALDGFEKYITATRNPDSPDNLTEMVVTITPFVYCATIFTSHSEAEKLLRILARTIPVCGNAPLEEARTLFENGKVVGLRDACTVDFHASIHELERHNKSSFEMIKGMFDVLGKATKAKGSGN